MSSIPKAAIAAAELASLQFDASFVESLQADTVSTNVPRQVSNAMYTRVQPTPVAEPRLLGWSEDLARALGITRPAARGLGAEVLGGNRVLPGMQPYAARYGGHQFGHWAGQLGDGRAITLAEMFAVDGSRQELQLKGAGRTPYSRTADGRAVLRSSVREFMCSEAMFHLGVPTTRALSLVGTGEAVIRDMFYDGNPAPEPGAVVCRVAPSFVRFGNFQILTARKEDELLRQLADYVMRMHFPAIGAGDYGAWYREICRRTALLIADWMRLGFVHGVMNTDNMSILGLTIDYGPYGWLEGYDPEWTPNTTDAEGRRYAYGNQPQIAHWNLARLAEALMPLIPDEARLHEGLDLYASTFNEAWRSALPRKLGMSTADENLVTALMEILSKDETDFTLFFRNLARVESAADLAPLRAAFYAPRDEKPLADWVARWLEHKPDRAAMDKVNPRYIFRNYLAQTAIDALEKGDASVMERLMQVLKRPYDEQPEHLELSARRPEWARHKAGCSALSCSS